MDSFHPIELKESMICALCDRVKLTQQNQYPYVIHEFKNSYLMLGEHQFYKGYFILVMKDHYREMTDLPKSVAHELLDEMLLTSFFIEKTFKPTKMNTCSLGNVVDHIHWHFFPRYKEDPDFKNPPWLQMAQFDSARLSPGEAEQIVKKMREEFKSFHSLSGIG
jgi:diadenosine tetraphosphate (Ap4A) HIT family hydrolase